MVNKKSSKRELNGLLILNKPLGISSNNILQRVKYMFRAKKAGHTGTLDPLATGMLPLCFGESTKFANLLLDGNKGYTVVAELGVRTNTSDREGEIISVKEVDISKEQILQTIKEHFIGEIQQQPTVWSAIKYKGKPLYEYAKEGIEVPRPIRTINIYNIEFISYIDKYLTLYIECSKGTYIRTLIDDLGEKLGCGAHVAQLHRNYVEAFKNVPMVHIEELNRLFDEKNFEQMDKFLLEIDAPVKHLEAINIDNFSTLKLCQGMTIICPKARINTYYRVFNNLYGFLGIAFAYQEERLRGYRLLSSTHKIVNDLKQDDSLLEKLSQNIKNPRTKNIKV